MFSLRVKHFHSDEQLKKSIEDFLSEWNNSNDYISAFTSGSTGKPKEIRLLKSKMIESAKLTGEFLGLKKNDKALLCLSIHTIGGKMMVVRSIILNLELFVIPVNSTPSLLLNESIDFIAMVPMQLSNFLKSDPNMLKSIRNVIIGGGIVSKEISESLKEKGNPVLSLDLTNDLKSLGSLCFSLMVATFRMAEALSVNAFDQPGVERSKELARKNLKLNH